AQVLERHAVLAAHASVHLVDLADEAVRRQPLRHRVGIEEGLVDAVGRGLENAVQLDGAGHSSLLVGYSDQRIFRAIAWSFAPRDGFNEPTYAIRPSRCARKSGTFSRFCVAGPCLQQLVRIAFSSSNSSRRTLAFSLTTMPVSTWRWPRCIGRVLRWLI